jgi:DivIVA protein.
MDTKTKFRIMRQGYDRFAVDDTISELVYQLEDSRIKLETYMKQVDYMNQQLTELKERYQQVVYELSTREKAADEISRMALKEAGVIIDAAQDNADTIVREALITSKTILIEIAKITQDVKTSRVALIRRLNTIGDSLNKFEISNAPDLDWLKSIDDH